MDRRLWLLVAATTALGLGHHVDHLIRGNHVGWPVIAEVTPFTWSLGFYPVILLGVVLSHRGVAGPGFWALLTAAGFFFVGLSHFGPVAAEPPADIVGAYRSPLAGRLALAWLAVFLVFLLGTALYGARRWSERRQSRRVQ